MTTFEIVISVAVVAILQVVVIAVSVGAGYLLGKSLPAGTVRGAAQQFVRNDSAERRVEELLTRMEGELQSMAAGGEPPKPDYAGTDAVRL